MLCATAARVSEAVLMAAAGDTGTGQKPMRMPAKHSSTRMVAIPITGRRRDGGQEPFAGEPSSGRGIEVVAAPPREVARTRVRAGPALDAADSAPPGASASRREDGSPDRR